MQRIASVPLEPRLQERYLILVQSHLRAAPELAAGVASLPGTASAFAATQATWRFLNNERVTLPTLVQPLREVAICRTQETQSPFVILVHDWCKLTFHHPQSKGDLTPLTHETDIGYELTTALLVSGDDGSPLAPMEMHLKTANGVHSTRDRAPKDMPHLDQLLPTMRASQSWGLGKPIMHIIDREADSVDHYRRWDKSGHKFLVRGDDRRVRWNGQSCLLSWIAKKLRRQKQLCNVGGATYEGRDAQLWVAETQVVLYRPAKKNLRDKRFERAGRALTLRFVVAEVRDENGRVLARWMLLSNVPFEWAKTEQLARCYYWRWKIESFFKLLKSHGQQLEEWRQQTGLAIARRLLVAAMACVVVWQLQADGSPAAIRFKNILVRLSGRQTKRKRPHTAPALLAGLWVLLSMLSLLEHTSLHQLKRLIERLPYIPSG